MSKQRAFEVFTATLPFLREFSPYARYLANYRDHALIVYDRRGGQLRPHQRKFPPITYRTPPPTPWTEADGPQRSLKC
jgi:hypothetical protein